jgi:hypothetical protein
MGPIQQDRQFTEHRAPGPDFGDLHTVLDDLHRAAPEDEESSRARSGGQHILARRVLRYRKVCEPLFKGDGVWNQGHVRSILSTGGWRDFADAMRARITLRFHHVN